MRFKDKVVLITGAGVGIGRAAAVQFGKEGAKVAINSLTPANGQETLKLVKATGAPAIYIQGDVSVAADAKRMVDETVKAFGRINILVNNADWRCPSRKGGQHFRGRLGQNHRRKPQGRFPRF